MRLLLERPAFTRYSIAAYQFLKLFITTFTFPLFGNRQLRCNRVAVVSVAVILRFLYRLLLHVKNLSFTILIQQSILITMWINHIYLSEAPRTGVLLRGVVPVIAGMLFYRTVIILRRTIASRSWETHASIKLARCLAQVMGEGC